MLKKVNLLDFSLLVDYICRMQINFYFPPKSEKEAIAAVYEVLGEIERGVNYIDVSHGDYTVTGEISYTEESDGWEANCDDVMFDTFPKIFIYIDHLTLYENGKELSDVKPTIEQWTN